MSIEHGNPSKDESAFTPVLTPDAFAHHIAYFNAMEDEPVVNHVANADSWQWLRENIPLFECPDADFERIYYYRWWTYRKHIKRTPDGFVLTEFITPVRHAGVHNTISCAVGHHIYEGRWLHEQRYLDEYALFWLRGNDGGPQPHLHAYSNWLADALHARYLVTGDRDFVVELLGDLVSDHRKWEDERRLDNGLFWQYDVRDGMEESISGSRSARNARPTINSYMYGNAIAISRIAKLAGDAETAAEFSATAAELQSLVQSLLWDDEAKFFKVRREDGTLADVREQLGLIPWYFNLPDPGYEEAWTQVTDPGGFAAPFGLTTAERRHPQFRSHGTGSCEWDGAVWPFATAQTLVGMANLLNDYEQQHVTKRDYFEALLTYARSHQKDGKPYIGEYLDEQTGAWLKGDNPRSRYYNHSCFCDLVISGLVGLRPRADEVIEVNPLVPEGTWDWFCLDNVRYHGRMLTILWDRTGTRYGRGPGLRVLENRGQLPISH